MSYTCRLNTPKKTIYGSPVVPFHLVIAPLSAIAGVHFPGQPSLYVSHNLRAIEPVYFGDKLTYSARISSIQAASRILRLSIAVFGLGNSIKVAGDMHVKCREREWDPSSNHTLGEVTTNQQDDLVLIVGASGELGERLAFHHAKQGADLLLTAREKNKELIEIQNHCIAAKRELTFVDCDLTKDNDLFKLKKIIKEKGGLKRVVYCASAPITSNLEEHMSVSFEALKQLCEACLPKFLVKQHGEFVFVSSTAIDSNPQGWENYVAGKAAAVNLISGYNSRYNEFGVRFWSFAPSMFKSEFSRPYWHSDNLPIVEEIVEEFFEFVLNGQQNEFRLDHSETSSQVENHKIADKPDDLATTPRNAEPENSNANLSFNTKILEDSIYGFLNVPEASKGNDVSMTTYSHWDSAKHIELILYLEETFSISFSARDIEQCTSISKLVKTCEDLIS